MLMRGGTGLRKAIWSPCAPTKNLLNVSIIVLSHKVPGSNGGTLPLGRMLAGSDGRSPPEFCRCHKCSGGRAEAGWTQVPWLHRHLHPFVRTVDGPADALHAFLLSVIVGEEENGVAVEYTRPEEVTAAEQVTDFFKGPSLRSGFGAATHDRFISASMYSSRSSFAP